MTTTVSVSAGEAPQSSTRVERVIWGKSYTDAVVNELHRLSTKRAFLVVSKSLNSDTDLVVRLEQALGQYFVGKKVGIRPHTPWEDIIELTKEIQSAKADVIITLGGGSITDAAKVALLAVANEVNTPDDLNTLVFDEQSVDTVLPPNIQLICIPTSLSGGEYNSGSGATDSRVGAKRIFRHPLCVPKSIILDPVITLHTPDWLWLYTGMRSVDHCVETLSSLNSNSESDDLAAIALKKLTGSLLQTNHNRQDISSRLQSLLGVWEATQASVMKEVD
ncbi:hypothetical protein K7432_013543 [Basidiobolus ranarum]|uniref:Alcohol dehydrogenase iron-type/glycerol dehydrogenase GldA domain-containing protein n=1 Tax=Basidiobolus ranarum TaxID=34480 RepID=A0ABR2WJ33_9FUNG